MCEVRKDDEDRVGEKVKDKMIRWFKKEEVEEEEEEVSG